MDRVINTVILISFAFFGCLKINCNADAVRSADSRILQSLKPEIEDYYKSYNQAPSTWDDLKKQPNGEIIEVLESIGAYDLYGFVGRHDLIDEIGGQQLILFRKQPIDVDAGNVPLPLMSDKDSPFIGVEFSYAREGDSFSKLRYALAINADSKISLISISESLAQRIITDYRIKIRPSGNIESFAAERRTTEGDEDIVHAPDIRPTSMTKTENHSVEVTENQPTQPTTSFPWLLAIVGLILLAVIAVIGFKVLGKSS